MLHSSCSIFVHLIAHARSAFGLRFDLVTGDPACHRCHRTSCIVRLLSLFDSLSAAVGTRWVSRFRPISVSLVRVGGVGQSRWNPWKVKGYDSTFQAYRDFGGCGSIRRRTRFTTHLSAERSCLSGGKPLVCPPQPSAGRCKFLHPLAILNKVKPVPI
mgnify:FL=1